jgi:hypothetical protein
VISPRNRKCLVALVLLLLCAIFLFVLFGKPPALPEVMILPPTVLAVKSGRVPDRWIPAKWVWLRQACRYVLGAPRRVGVQDVWGGDSNTVAAILAQNSLGKPDAEGDGLALWILPGRTLQPLDGPPYHAVSGSVVEDNQQKSGMTHARGYSMYSFARLDKESVDLWISFAYNSPSQTNSALAVRVQLPHDKALFFLDVRQPELASNRTECLITSDEFDAKGNKIQGSASGR